MPAKKSRGKPFTIGPEGRAMCLYLALNESGGNPGSVLGNLGMPSVPGDGTGLLNMRAGISRALAAAARVEEKERGFKPMVDRLTRRWSAYLAMLVAKNQIAVVEDEVSRLLAAHHNGCATLEEVQEAEEKLLQLKADYEFVRKRNDSLRKGHLYMEMMGVFREKLLEEGIRA